MKELQGAMLAFHGHALEHYQQGPKDVVKVHIVRIWRKPQIKPQPNLVSSSLRLFA